MREMEKLIREKLPILTCFVTTHFRLSFPSSIYNYEKTLILVPIIFNFSQVHPYEIFFSQFHLWKIWICPILSLWIFFLNFVPRNMNLFNSILKVHNNQGKWIWCNYCNYNNCCSNCNCNNCTTVIWSRGDLAFHVGIHQMLNPLHYGWIPM